MASGVSEKGPISGLIYRAHGWQYLFLSDADGAQSTKNPDGRGPLPD
jgi:hypothetical protein